MGDRFILKLKCVYCGLESDVWYAPTCGYYDFTCQMLDEPCTSDEPYDPKQQVKKLGCRKINFICGDFRVKKIEDVTEEDVIQAFEMASTAYHKPNSIKKMAKEYLRGLKKHGH